MMGEDVRSLDCMDRLVLEEALRAETIWRWGRGFRWCWSSWTASRIADPHMEAA